MKKVMLAVALVVILLGAVLVTLKVPGKAPAMVQVADRGDVGNPGALARARP
jgi:hypothetical protein